MIETIKEYYESANIKWSDKSEIAYKDLERALDDYNKAFKVNFKPLIEGIFKVVIEYNKNNK